MTFCAQTLATLLDEANHHPSHSVRAALAGVGGQPHPRVGWLTTHLAARKRACWAQVAAASGTPAPPDDAGLTRVMAWEVTAARALTPAQLGAAVTPGEAGLDAGGPAVTVAELLRVNVRHTTWHAGQIAALARGTRSA